MDNDHQEVKSTKSIGDRHSGAVHSMKRYAYYSQYNTQVLTVERVRTLFRYNTQNLLSRSETVRTILTIQYTSTYG